MTRHETRAQGLRFVLVGAISAAVYFCMALLFDKVLGLAPVYSSVCAYVVSSSYSFLGHKKFTFHAKGNSRREVLKFTVSALIGFAIATIIPYLLSPYGAVLSYFTVLVAVPVTSFILLKFFVFSNSNAP